MKMAKKKKRVCEQCGKELSGEVVKVQDPYTNVKVHYFCDDECAKDWLFDYLNAEWVDLDAEEEEDCN